MGIHSRLRDSRNCPLMNMGVFAACAADATWKPRAFDSQIFKEIKIESYRGSHNRAGKCCQPKERADHFVGLRTNGQGANEQPTAGVDESIGPPTGGSIRFALAEHVLVNGLTHEAILNASIRALRRHGCCAIFSPFVCVFLYSVQLLGL